MGAAQATGSGGGGDGQRRRRRPVIGCAWTCERTCRLGGLPSWLLLMAAAPAWSREKGRRGGCSSRPALDAAPEKATTTIGRDEAQREARDAVGARSDRGNASESVRKCAFAAVSSCSSFCLGIVRLPRLLTPPWPAQTPWAGARVQRRRPGPWEAPELAQPRRQFHGPMRRARRCAQGRRRLPAAAATAAACRRRRLPPFVCPSPHAEAGSSGRADGTRRLQRRPPGTAAAMQAEPLSLSSPL